jgi:hypothetical protein
MAIAAHTRRRLIRWGIGVFAVFFLVALLLPQFQTAKVTNCGPFFESRRKAREAELKKREPTRVPID